MTLLPLRRVLPVQLTSFVGRVNELAQIRRLLQSRKLVTLVGQGGVGKTRLALRAAERGQNLFADGVVVVELSPVDEPGLITTAIVEACGIDTSSRPPLDLVLDYVRGRSMLLVLDNCEHLAEHVGPLCEDLLCAAPKLGILATSRQPLSVRPESLFEVPPLPLPETPVTVASAMAYPAVALFIDRAAAAIPGYQPSDSNILELAELCTKLEGLPLAIELAAVRLKVLSVRELGERLHDRLQILADRSPDRPERHRTLRASLDWTFELCSPVERRLWATTSLFRGGFSVEAAEAVFSPSDRPFASDLLGALAGLVDKSVLTRSESRGRSRFHMLETIKTYGASLPESDYPRPRTAYVRWCRDLVDRSATTWFSRQPETFDTLREEHTNLRTAMTMGLADSAFRKDALHIAASLWFYWVPRAHSEGRQWLELLLNASSDDPPGPERAHALISLAYLLVMQGSRTTGNEMLHIGRELAMTFGDELCVGYASHIRGLSTFFDGDFVTAAQLFKEADACYTRLGAATGWTVALRVHNGLLSIFRGDIAHAEDLLLDAQKLCEADDERWLKSYVLYGLAFIDFESGRFPAALERLKHCVELKEPFDDVVGTALVLELTSWIRVAQSDAEKASVALGAARQLWGDFGMELYGSDAWLRRRQQCLGKGASLIGEVPFRQGCIRGAKMTRRQALKFAIGVDVETQSGDTSPKDKRTEHLGTPTPLSRRELQIAALVAEGLTNRAIAERLTISVRTVDGHVQQVLHRLGFNTRAQIAAWVSAQTVEET